MRMVIDLPKEKDFIDRAIWEDVSDFDTEELATILHAIAQGTVLPEQARVIDMNKLAITPIDITDLPYDKCLMVYYPEDLDESTILLEAREDGE